MDKEKRALGVLLGIFLIIMAVGVSCIPIIGPIVAGVLALAGLGFIFGEGTEDEKKK